MKIANILFALFIAVAFTVTIHAQQNSASPNGVQSTSGPVMTFESMILDYGTIVQHSEPLRIAKFTNTGTAPLIVTSARGSCGCTVPDYPKQPIMPGESAQIEVRYATDRLGQINKTVTITTNEGGEAHVLKVVGEINPKPADVGVPGQKNSLLKPNNN